jgi:acetyltransferase
MFFPSSIALLGASRNPGSFAWRILSYLRGTYQGDLYLVNPRYDEIDGLPCYPSVRELPGGAVPDAAMILTAADAAIALLDEAEQTGVRAATIFAAGFGEAKGGGDDRIDRVEDIIARGRIRLCGPNTIGLVNYFNNAVMYSSANIPQSLDPDPLAMVTQSGGTGGTFINKAFARGMGVGLLATIGNAIDVGMPEYVRYFASLDEISTIALYVEASPNARELVGACLAAAEAGKTVLMYRAGRTSLGARMAASHTGVLAQSPAVLDDIFRSAGVIVHDSLDDMVDTAYATVRLGPIKTPGIAVYSPSGGSTVQTADIVEQKGLELTPLAPDTVAFLEKTYPFATPGNPYDPTGLWRNDPDHLPSCISAIANDPSVSALVQVMPAWYADYALVHADVMGKVAEATDTPIMSAVMKAGTLTRPLEDALREQGIPVFESLEGCFGALGRLAARSEGDRWSRPEAPPVELPDDRSATFRREAGGLEPGPLDEVASKRLMQAYGIPVVEEVIAHSVDGARAAAERVGYPVVLKKLVPGLTHKTEATGVRLSLHDAEAVEHAYLELADPEHRTVVVQRMVSGTAELIVGGRRDPQLGPIVIVGAGGILSELLQDISGSLAPIATIDAERMLGALRVSRLLAGFRGAAPVPLRPICDILTSLSWLLVEQPQVQEVDLNPVIVSADGAVAVDALVVLNAD